MAPPAKSSFYAEKGCFMQYGADLCRLHPIYAGSTHEFFRVSDNRWNCARFVFIG